MEQLPKKHFGSTDSVLLAQAQTQEAEAWNRLVRLYGPLVEYWLRNAGLQSADRADVFQEVFQAVAKNLGNFRRERPGDTFRGWMRTIASSKVADHFRRKKKTPVAAGGTDAQLRFTSLAAPDVHDDGSSSDAAERSELSRQALGMIREAFEPKSWQAFWRMAIDGQSANDVGQELGMKPEAVRKAKSRVLRRLKEEFGQLLE